MTEWARHILLRAADGCNSSFYRERARLWSRPLLTACDLPATSCGQMTSTAPLFQTRQRTQTTAWKTTPQIYFPMVITHTLLDISSYTPYTWHVFSCIMVWAWVLLPPTYTCTHCYPFLRILDWVGGGGGGVCLRESCQIWMADGGSLPPSVCLSLHAPLSTDGPRRILGRS